MSIWKYLKNFPNSVNISLEFSVEFENKSDNNKEDQKESGEKGKDVEESFVNLETERQEDEITVEFRGDRYEVNLNKLINVSPEENLREFVDSHYEDFLFHAFRRYKEFVEENKDYIALILYGRQIIGADEKRVYNGLKECYDYFVEHENYEEAAVAKELIEEMEDG